MQAQLALPLDGGRRAGDDAALREAWLRTRLPVPYHVALQVPAMAICLRCLVDAGRRKRNERL